MTSGHHPRRRVPALPRARTAPAAAAARFASAALAAPVAAAALAIATALGGCATPRPAPVTVETAPDRSVATAATFAWAESGISWPERPSAAVDAELRALVRDAVVAELARRGYAEAPLATADFVVSFHATVRETSDHELCFVRNRVLESDPTREVEVCRGGPATRIDRTYREGTLVVFVVDRRDGVLLWQGVADDSARTVAQARARLRGAVERLFAEFPERAR
jgi:hypothetical protein